MLQESLTEETARTEPTAGPPRILVAIPAYNEEIAIGSVVIKALRHAYEVVVVDDGSADETAEVAAAAGAQVIRHARNLGKGLAIRTAWLYARGHSPDAFVLLDGDYQHEPGDIPRLAAPVLDGDSDVVIGKRWGKSSKMPSYRRIGKRLLDYATAASRRNGVLTDSQSGFRVFSATALDRIEPEEAGLGIESQMLIDAQDAGLKVLEVDIEARYDNGTPSQTPVQQGISVMSSIVSLVSERRPLFFFGLPGFGLAALGMLFALLAMQIYYSTGQFVIGYAFLVLLFTTIGILFVFTGIVLNALRRHFGGVGY